MDNYSLSDIKAATEGGNDGMFGGGSWAVVLIILFLIIMMGGGGWGNRVGDGGVATQGEVQRGFDQQTTTSKLDQLAYGLASSGYETANLVNGVNTTMMQGFNEAARQLSECCCTIQRGIDSVNYNAAINTSNIIQAQERGTQKILDYLCGQETQRLRDENMRNYIASQFCGVVRYPSGFTYSAGSSPFCGCGCGCGNNF